jgi:hypothetical protein
VPSGSSWTPPTTKRIEWDGMDWIDLAHDRDQYRDLVNTAMNLRVP